MCVAGQEVNAVCLEKRTCQRLTAATETARNRSGSDLDEASAPHPFGNRGMIAEEAGIALGMRDDRGDSEHHEAEEDVGEHGCVHELWEFHQQVIRAVDCVPGLVLFNLGEIFIGEVEVAA